MNSFNKVVAATTSIMVLFSLFVLTNGDHAKPVEGGGMSYAINFTADDPAVIRSDTYGDGVKTIKGVQFDYHQAWDTPGYHTQLIADGSIENLNQQITSIKRVKAVFDGALTFWAGDEAGNCNAGYALVSNEYKTIADAPYFMRLVADTTTLITSLEIDYSCSTPVGSPIYSLSPDTTYYTLTGYSRFPIDIVIPSEYNGKPVKEIGDRAFANSKTLKSVVIPDSVTTIGAEAFDSCDYLESVTMPDTVTSIGTSAFDYCVSLTAFHIPTGLTHIPDYLLAYDISLTSLTIPASVTSIGQEVFNHCVDLSTITFEDESQIASIGYSAFQSTAWIVNKRLVDPLIIVNNIVIDGTATTGAVVIPEGVTSMVEYAFIDMNTYTSSTLTSITFPSTMTAIPQSSFYGCAGLTEVTFSTSITTIGAWAFSSCGLVHLTLPDNILTIGPNAFDNNYSLLDITLSGGLSVLEHDLFNGCNNLTSVTFKSGLTQIEQSVFNECADLNNVVIPDGVTTIGSFAFGYCSSLDTLTIPSSVTTIDFQSFWKTPWMTAQRALGNHVVIINGLILDGTTATGAVTVDSGATAVGTRAFRMNYDITSMILPEGIVTIGEYAFDETSNLASVVIPSSVTSLGYAAFYNNTNLATVYYGGANVTEWNTIVDNSGNDQLMSATRYYYSATGASGCWHYVSGVPTLWVD